MIAPGSETWAVMRTTPSAMNSRFQDQATVRRRVRGPAAVSSPLIAAT